MHIITFINDILITYEVDSKVCWIHQHTTHAHSQWYLRMHVTQSATATTWARDVAYY